MNGKTMYLGGLILMLVLASGIVSAAVTSLTGFIGIEKSAEQPNVLEIGVLTATPAVQTDGGSASEVYKEVIAACAGSTDYTSCLVKEFEARNVNPATAMGLSSIQNAEFMVTYYNPATGSSVVVPGCEEIIADQSREISYYGTPVQYYYGTCTVDENLYKGVRISVTATLVGGVPEGVSVNAPPQSIELSGVEATPLSAMLMQVVSGLVGDSATLPCLGVFLILGLLLASMYFSGKSPVTMLDITTPRLPMPKGLSAGGQVMLPYGYGEMKGALNKKMAVAAGAAAASAKALKGKMGHDAEMDKMNRQIEDYMKTAQFKGAALGEGKQAEDMMKSIAAAGRAAGKSAADMKPMLGKLPYHYGDAEHKTIAEILERLNTMGEREKLMGGAIKDYMLSMRTLSTLDKISGHPEMGRSVAHHKVEKALGSMVGRYTLMGGTIGAGAAGSWKRSVEVVGRGTKEMVMQAPTLARGIARTTMTMVGGERAVEELERKRPEAAAWLKKPARTVEVGHMLPVNEKMDHLYNVIKEEAVKGESQYLLKQIYKGLGVNFAITEEELVKMGYKDMDVLEASGYNKNAARIKQVEPEIVAILASKELNAVQKRDALMELAKTHGAVIDQNMLQFNEKLAAIEASADPGYMKFLKLQEMLVQHERSTQAAAEGQVMTGDKFYTLVGRSSVAGSDLWDTMVFRSLIRDAEKGELINAGLKEEAQIAWLKTVNRMVSLRPTSNLEELPEFMRDHAELSKIEKRINSTLGGLLTEEGRASLQRFTGKDISNATIEDHVKVLYGGKSLAPKDYEEIGKTGKVAFWGEAKEMGALKGNYKGFVDEIWVDKLDPRAPLPIGSWTRNMFYRSYIEPTDPAIEAKLNRTPGSAHWSPEEWTERAKQEWTKKLIKEDMEQRFNSQFALNAYGKLQETATFYAGITAGFLEKALTDKGLAENHPDLEFARTLDASNPSQLRRLKEMLGKYKSEYEEVLSKPVTYDDIVTSKQALVMLYEGGFAYAHKGMALGTADRVYGTVTLRDNKGQKREFAPEDVMIDFHGREDLKAQFYKLRDSKNPQDWSTFMDATHKWAREGGYNYDREKVFAALVWEYGNNTNDYRKYYAKTSLEVTPKKEAIPLAPEALRMFGIEGGKVSEMLKPWRNIKNDVGDFLGKASLVAGGPVFRASADITPVSEYLRQQSWRLAANVFTKDLKSLTPAERAAYEQMGITHFEYHQKWEWTVDRNPWAHSTSHGLHQAMESYFHYGPRSVFASEDYLKATMPKSQWYMFKAGPYGAVADIATKMHQIPTNMFGGMQMAMQGYPSRWDMTGNPLKPWDYTPTRASEALRALNPFSFNWAKEGIGKMTGKLNVWEGSLERRQLVGPDIMKGLVQAPQDIYGKRVGAAAVARLGDANPGASYYDYSYKLKLDPRMAEWMTKNKDATFMHDQEVKEQAMSNTMRRTVSMEALSIRRSQEMRQFGMLQNSIYGFFNAPLFLWHMSVPGMPPSMSPKEQLMKAARRIKTGGGMNLGAVAEDAYQKTVTTTTRVMQPWKGAMLSYCKKCGRAGYKGSRCVCGGVIYGQ